MLLREHDRNIMDFIDLGHDSMRKGMRGTDSKSQLLKYAGCSCPLRIDYC